MSRVLPSDLESDLAPPHRRDRRPAAGSADRAHGRSCRGSPHPSATQRRRRAAPTGARGGDPAPARRAQPAAGCRRRRWCGSGASCSPRRHGRRAPSRSRSTRPPDAPGFWDIARDHYGSHTPMLAFGSAGAGHPRRHRGPGATVGVLPMPQEEDPDPWWRHLLSTHDTAPHVIARLPFGGRGNARSDSGDALAIGRGAQQPTGRDRTLIATENAPNISRGRLFSTLAGLDLRCTFIASSEHAEGGQHADRDRRVRAALTIRASIASARSSGRRYTGCCGSAATPCRCRRPSCRRSCRDAGVGGSVRHRGERLQR